MRVIELQHVALPVQLFGVPRFQAGVRRPEPEQQQSDEPQGGRQEQVHKSQDPGTVQSHELDPLPVADHGAQDRVGGKDAEEKADGVRADEVEEHQGNGQYHGYGVAEGEGEDFFGIPHYIFGYSHLKK